jgi:hypothetical protein
MLPSWHQDLEALETMAQNDLARRLLQRMAELSRNGRLRIFLEELRDDAELDETTKAVVAEIARDESFLHVVDDYVERTAVLH